MKLKFKESSHMITTKYNKSRNRILAMELKFENIFKYDYNKI